MVDATAVNYCHRPMAVAVIGVILAWVGMGFLCSYLAAQRGRSAGLFLVLGLLFPIITLIICAVMLPPQLERGSVVQLVSNVRLDDGRTLRSGWRSQVHDVSVMNNTKVVAITDEAGQRRWVAANAVKLL